MITQTTNKKSTLWGIIALVVSIVSLFAPVLFLSLFAIVVVIFAIVGLVWDGNKIPSIVALVLFGLAFWSNIKMDEVQQAAKEKLYNVRYKVICESCDISYTNDTGGTNKLEDKKGVWFIDLKIGGDQFIYLSAQNASYSKRVEAQILIDDLVVKSEVSEGGYSIASVSCRPSNP